MNLNEEAALLKMLFSGETLNVVHAGVLAQRNEAGEQGIFLAMTSLAGKRYVVPLGRDVALSLGEQMVRAVDAIDAGLVPTIPTPR